VKRINGINKWFACFTYIGSILLFSSCGNQASPDATIIGPEDIDITYNGYPAVFDQSAAPLEFQVFAPEAVPGGGPPSGGTTVPLAGARIRFFGGGQVVALTSRNGLGQLDFPLPPQGPPCLINVAGLPQRCLTPNDNTSFETETDEVGLSPTDVYAVWAVPQCQSDPTDPNQPGDDIEVTGTVTATVGTASMTWTINIIVKGGPGTSVGGVCTG
jgi:hypothetical protein